ncbi:MAG: bifunctional UDP-N-acetylglucosamine diphosphorylase/glucosamine-1-phosphate N-acetyltransferase GlmU, partial [Acidobacteria bacterium]|nr:bifunctional UDP-N-acetylglucosamine diphosphorylase/glucosamine-1-phosphate N-acetyltransferase GlmU [Acidobacteriota bacterium]
MSALGSASAQSSVSATTAVVILAAGKGVRMRSARPKVLHAVGGRPMLDRVLELAARHAGASAPRLVVVGAQRDEVEAHLARSDPRAIPAVQEPQRGTGDAVRCALAALGETPAERILVLSGDVPLLAPGTLLALEAAFGRHGCAVAFLTAIADEPGAYGRVVRNEHGAVTRIVEARDASAAELLVRETNAGVYLFDRAFLSEALPRLGTANAQGEWYLTDVIGLAVDAGRPVEGVLTRDATEILGANSRADLARIESALQTRLAAAAMAEGVTLVRPETVTLEDGVTFEPDAVLEPFVSLAGATHVSAGARIGQGSILRDTKVGPGVTVKPYTVAEGATIGAGSIVGPFARLREGTELEEGVHVGNFVETKKARLARGAKANHLTYLGDCSVGERTNVG